MISSESNNSRRAPVIAVNSMSDLCLSQEQISLFETFGVHGILFSHDKGDERIEYYATRHAIDRRRQSAFQVLIKDCHGQFAWVGIDGTKYFRKEIPMNS